MKTGNRKRGSEKGKGRNISGRKSMFLPMTGTTGQMRSAGELPGQCIATDIWRRINRLITAPMSGRAWIRNRQSMKALQPEAWSAMAGQQTAVK